MDLTGDLWSGTFFSDVPANGAGGCRTPDYRWEGQMKISKISTNMFRQIFQNLPQYVRIRSGICKIFQILSGWRIQPPKSGILFWLANLASKNCNFTYLPVLSTNSSKNSLKKSLSTHPVSRHGSPLTVTNVPYSIISLFLLTRLSSCYAQFLYILIITNPLHSFPCLPGILPV